MNENVQKRYPLVLVHGCGFRDSKVINYWGRIPAALIRQGEQVFYAHQDAWATVETNAATIKQSILDVLRETGAEKVNIIAHSKGGLECRYMISSLGMADKVACLTTVSTPHRGSKSADVLCRLPECLFGIAGAVVNGWNRFLGDRNPDFVTACRQFTSEYCRVFNAANPDAENVIYHSYATVMKSASSDVFMSVPYLFVKAFDGESDGLVSTGSAQWTDFRGVYTGAGRRGISHADSVDMRRCRLNRSKTDVGDEFAVRDITELYLRIASELPTPED